MNIIQPLQSFNFWYHWCVKSLTDTRKTMIVLQNYFPSHEYLQREEQ
ncbi:MAG: hypothetical protein ACKO2V_08555 [Snowella sp.]